MFFVLHHWNIHSLSLWGRGGSSPVITFWTRWYAALLFDMAKLLVLCRRFWVPLLMLYSLLFCMGQCILVLIWSQRSQKYFFLCGVKKKLGLVKTWTDTQVGQTPLTVSWVSVWPWTNHFNFTLLLIPRFYYRLIKRVNKVTVNIILF